MHADPSAQPASADLRAAVLDALADVVGTADLAALPGDADIRVALEVDSFDLQVFMEGVAARTGIEVPEGDYALVVTVDGCLDYLRAHGA